MSLGLLIFSISGIFFLAYFFYSKKLSKQFQLNSETKTPACLQNDGIDYVPTSKFFLLAQHFSAISAAGPIVGPILAGIWFGWLPALLWIVFGAIFLGAVHDFSTLVGSVRHKAHSIVDIVKDYLGPKGHLLFLTFVWFSLIYVITAFTDLTSSSFAEPELGGAIASSSILYLILGLAMGICLKKFKMPLLPATFLFIGLVCLAIWGGQFIPLQLQPAGGLSTKQCWNFILLAYCGIASILPIWLLLQPRGYLGGFFLYGTLLAGLLGIFIGKEIVSYTAWSGWESQDGKLLFPALFVTVACGACSGFHGIVSSGTTSKQVKNEKDCQLVGYGAMLLEALMAVLALATVMVLSKADPLLKASPDRIFAEGLSRFVVHLGVPMEFARGFTLLAFTTFIYDTLDVATRLARYLLEEITGLKGWAARLLLTILCLVLPALFLMVDMRDAAGHWVPAWKMFWTVFGTSNQLLAALSLFILYFWLKKENQSYHFLFLPMIFMLIVTFTSLISMLWSWMLRILVSGWTWDLNAAAAFILITIAGVFIVEGFFQGRSLKNK